MPLPAAAWLKAPGNCRDGSGFLFSSICVAEKATNSANSTDSVWPLTSANTPAPAARPPSAMPGAMRRTMSQRTAPRRWCARTLDNEVKSTVAIAVAIAIFTDRSSSTPRLDKMIVRNGTMIALPPTPNMPANKPPTVPSASSSAINKAVKTSCFFVEHSQAQCKQRLRVPPRGAYWLRR
jgi:hypothetical protein